MTDPFSAHPELRGKIADPLQSFYRQTDFRALILSDPRAAAFRPLLLTEKQRLASRDAALAGRSGDLWVFAYGSLMWDPGIDFDRVLRAYAPDHARAFILKDIYGGRGSVEAPGLMAALDDGAGCSGLAFRIPAARVLAETEILWRREMVGASYLPAFIPLRTAEGEAEALAFLADHTAEPIRADLGRAEQVHFIATGCGFLGSSLDYLTGIYDQFQALGIDDHDVDNLLAEVLEYRTALAAQPA